MAAPPTIMGHPAIKNNTENIINAYVLPTWLIIYTTKYRGVDAHLHPDALSSLQNSFNHDFVCNLDTNLSGTHHA